MNFGAQVPQNEAVQACVKQMVQLFQPAQVFWCDGSEAEKDFLTQEAVKAGILIQLNQEKWPGCYYHRSHPNA